MRVLQINCEYKTGSTGKIADCIAQGLKKVGHEVFTCYGLSKHPDDGESECICTPMEHKFNALLARIDGIPFGGYYIANSRFKEIVYSFKPDVVHVHCINGYTINIYQLLRFLGRSGIKTVITLHAEFFFTGGCAHSYECTQWLTGCNKCSVFKKSVTSWFFDRANASWKKMYDAFSYFKPENIKIVAVSPWLEKRAKQSAILKRFDVRCIYNGVNTNVFKLTDTEKQYLNHEDGRKNILFVTAYFSTNISDSKGGGYLVELAKRCPIYNFIVVSRRFEPANGNLPANIHIYGSTNDQQELAYLYSEADLSITLGKRETFSMIVAESLCCGTPIVGFMAGGPESITIPDYSNFVEYGSVDKLELAVNDILKCAHNKERIAQRSQDIYSDSRMSNEYIELYFELTR